MPASSAPLRLAMLGMIAGNGHPYSWSAIVNGFNPEAMAECPYSAIPEYLSRQPAGSVGLSDAKVTHIWTDIPAQAGAVARAALIPQVVARPEDVIGEVDAVMIATDDGFDHLARARPFLEAGLPVFVDKPLALAVPDLEAFINARKNGARLLSSSGLRYAPELTAFLRTARELGEIRWASGLTCVSWERYGIHLLEPLLRVLGPGFISVRLDTGPGREVAHLQHASGVQANIVVIGDGGATFGTLHFSGTEGQRLIQLTDTYTAFRDQIVSFVDYVRTGRDPHPFAETVELMSVLIAGRRSRAEGSRRVPIQEILPSFRG